MSSVKQTNQQLRQTELIPFSPTSSQVIVSVNDLEDFITFRTLFLIMILLYLLFSERYRDIVLHLP